MLERTPDTATVKQKMVFASSRAQVLLGLTKGSGVIDIQATDDDEVSYESGAWNYMVS